MNLTDWGVVGGFGLLGWAVVSWLIKVVRQQRAPSVVLGHEKKDATPEAMRSLPSLSELGNTWHKILGVSADATTLEIENAYHKCLGECDRIRFSPTEAESDRRNAEQRRLQVNEAFEFIRRLKQ